VTLPNSSLEPLRKRVEEFPQNELFRFSLGKALFDAGDFVGAIEQFEVALARKPDWMVVAILLGRSWQSRGDLKKAREYLELGQRLAREQNHEGPLEETTELLKHLG
jgi:tetratricopeptide (TPR) repeat protein